MTSTSPNRPEQPAPEPPRDAQGGTQGGLRAWSLRRRDLQILVNLLSNARQALTTGGSEPKRLTIRVRRAPEGGRLLLQVIDNGTGITPENLTRVFTQGFTTKKDGHGFGLHISALAAEEMNGKLTCASEGPGRGATFTLELPIEGAGS